MNHTRAVTRGLLFTAVAGVAVVGVSACSDDGNKLPAEERNTGRVTLPPAGLDDCQQVYNNFWFAMLAPASPALSLDTPSDDPNQQLDFEQVFEDLSAGMPADLQGDLAILADAFIEYGEILADHNFDFRSLEEGTMRQLLATPEVTQAMENIDAAFLATCPGLT